MGPHNPGRIVAHDWIDHPFPGIQNALQALLRKYVAISEEPVLEHVQINRAPADGRDGLVEFAVAGLQPGSLVEFTSHSIVGNI